MSNNSVSNFMKVSELYFNLNESKKTSFNVDKTSTTTIKKLTLNNKRKVKENTSAM